MEEEIRAERKERVQPLAPLPKEVIAPYMHPTAASRTSPTFPSRNGFWIWINISSSFWLLVTALRAVDKIFPDKCWNGFPWFSAVHTFAFVSYFVYREQNVKWCVKSGNLVKDQRRWSTYLHLLQILRNWSSVDKGNLHSCSTSDQKVYSRYIFLNTCVGVFPGGKDCEWTTTYTKKLCQETKVIFLHSQTIE